MLTGYMSLSATACTPCAIGFYSGERATACQQCIKGYYPTSSTVCTQCVKGTYKTTDGTDTCTTCPADAGGTALTTSGAGSTTSSACSGELIMLPTWKTGEHFPIREKLGNFC